MNFYPPLFRPNIARLKMKRDLKGLVCAFLYGEEEAKQVLSALEEINSLECALMITTVLNERGISDENKEKFLSVLQKLDAAHAIEGLLAYALNQSLLQHSTHPLDVEVKMHLMRLSALASPQQLSRYPKYLLPAPSERDENYIQQLLETIQAETPITYQREVDQLLEMGWQPQTAYHQALVLARRGDWEAAAAIGMEAFSPLIAWRVQVERGYQELEKMRHLDPIDSQKTQAYLEEAARLNRLLLSLGSEIIEPLLKMCERYSFAIGVDQPRVRVACELLVESAKRHPEFQSKIIKDWIKLLEDGHAPHEIGAALYEIAPGSNVRLMLAKQLPHLIEQFGELAITPLCEIDHDERIPLSDNDRALAAKILIKLLAQYPQYTSQIGRFFEARLVSSESNEYYCIRQGLCLMDWHPQTPLLQIFQYIFQHNWQGCLESGAAAIFPLLKDLNFYCKTARDYPTAQGINDILNRLYMTGNLLQDHRKAIEAQDGQVIIKAFTPASLTVYWDDWRDRPSDETINDILSSEQPKSQPAFIFRLKRNG
ncbi:hypothetical protein ADN00_08615 [Ornatilinea apprima]|uniref:Uncharacterized protein n=1 Tax=Ornatilinea apprima TaxID=1134406 RepID=A0A0N8GNB7_9CHLR|nr:hypothetical protein [Ornatilinea apprima]KPL77650.1 hypothetical protein ADN00_08615 [Ornatilinea apprima]